MKQDKAVARAAKIFKWTGIGVFVAANLYLVYRMSFAYWDGQTRGEKIHQQRQAKKKALGQKKEEKPTIPQQLQPEYVQRQVRKYKQMAQEYKKQKQSSI